jgi:predicted phage gp36 major capsid-like protein
MPAPNSTTLAEARSASTQGRSLNATEARLVSDLRADLDKAKVTFAQRAVAQRAARSLVNAQPVRPGARDQIATSAYSDAWTAYALRGMQSLTITQRRSLEAGESRDLSVSTGSAGGYITPPAFEQRLSSVLTASSPVRSVATILNTPDSRTLSWPSSSDQAASAHLLTENSPQTEDFDPTFAKVQIKGFPLVSMARVPRSLDQDTVSVYSTQGQYSAQNNGLRSPNPVAGFPNNATDRSYQGIGIADIVATMCGARLARGENPYYTSGSGSSQPLGITAAATGATAGSATVITLADLAALWFGGLDPIYRGADAVFMMAPSTAKAVRLLTDTAGVLLFPANQPLRVFGAPVIENRDMASIATGAVSVVAGSFSRGFVIRQQTGTVVMRLEERFAEYAQLGFLAAIVIDSVIDDPGALRKLVHP